MWTRRQKAAGPSLTGLAFSLPILPEHACVCVYCISVGVHLSECTVIARLITRHFPPEARQNVARWLQLRRAFPPSRAFARDRVSLCIMQTGNLCPLSSWCGHCSACHSLLSAHATRRTPRRQTVEEEEKNNWLALSCDMWQSFKRHLFYKADWMDVSAIKEKQLFITVFFFWDIVGVYLYSNTERKRQTDILAIAWLKWALLKDRILIFNALQLYQLNQISSEGITCMVKNVRCYKCLAETDRISQEMCVDCPEDGESLTLSLRVY